MRKQIVHSPQDLGQYIQRIRKLKKLTQEEAGASFRIDQTTFSSIEMGAKGTRLETLFRVLAALNLEMVIQERSDKEAREKMEW